MQIRLDILRRENASAEPYMQSILYNTDDENAALSTALTEINDSPDIKDTDGKTVSEIRWERSCLQKKCGFCAMVVNGVPRLACDVRLAEFAKRGYVKIEPLRKFPVVADLIVDRSIMTENLRNIGLWLSEHIIPEEDKNNIAFEASRCLQCGCCLEVCPNFYVGSDFMGMAAGVPASKLIEQLSAENRADISESYKKHVYGGCGKSLACRNICPAGIEIDRLMVNSNSAAVWKFMMRKRR